MRLIFKNTIMNYLDREILESMLSRTDSFALKAGRRVSIITGIHKGKEGVIQNISHVKTKPLQKDKIRVWLDGFSCIDIFDFHTKDIKLIPYSYINGLGYF